VEPWQLLLLLLVGTAGVTALASPAAPPAGPPITPVQNDIITRAFEACLATEADGAVIKTFSGKLRSSGFTAFADALDQKLARMTMIATGTQRQTFQAYDLRPGA
jgi:hypothetical protein